MLAITIVAAWVLPLVIRAQPRVDIVGDIGAPSTGADKGAACLYARTPFGVHLERVDRSAPMPCETQTTARFHGRAPAWR